jgi:cardiolipin synthase
VVVSGEPMVSERIFTVPNLLSLLRLGLVPIFLLLVLTRHDLAAIAVLMISGFTDYLDGTLARRLGQITRVGQLLDPIADRLYIFTTLLALAYREIVPWWLVAVLVARDLVLTGTVLLLKRAGHGPLPVHLLGKAATFNLLYAFPLLLLGDSDGTAGEIALPLGWAFAWWGTALYWWAAVLYLQQVRTVLRPDRAGPLPAPPGTAG